MDEMEKVEIKLSITRATLARLDALSAEMGGAKIDHVVGVLVDAAEIRKPAKVRVRPLVVVDGISGPISVGVDFLDTLRSMLRGGSARFEYFPEDYANNTKWNYGRMEAPVIGWVDNYVNLYPVETFKHARDFYDRLGSSNAIYNELRAAGHLAMTGERGQTTKKRIGPDGKQHRVLVLTHSALSEIKS